MRKALAVYVVRIEVTQCNTEVPLETIERKDEIWKHKQNGWKLDKNIVNYMQLLVPF